MEESRKEDDKWGLVSSSVLVIFSFFCESGAYLFSMPGQKATDDIFKGDSEWFTALEYLYQRQIDPFNNKWPWFPNVNPEQPTGPAYIRKRHENEESLAKIKNLTWNYWRRLFVSVVRLIKLNSNDGLARPLSLWETGKRQDHRHRRV